jgi:hypothetical protein
VAEVLSDNAAMLKVFDKSELKVTKRSESQAIDIVLRLA